MPTSSRSAAMCVALLLVTALAGAQDVPPSAPAVALALPQSPLSQPSSPTSPTPATPVTPPAAEPVAAAIPALWLKMALDDTVAFAGRPSDDAGASNGRGNNMAYPAVSALTFLVAVATHGVLANSDLERQKKAREEQSNRILLPYRPLLDQYKYAELGQAWLQQLQQQQPGKKVLFNAASAPAPGDLVIESQPRYLLTQDQRAIIVDNAVAISQAGAAPAYRVVIRVVSEDIGAEGPQQAWTNSAGRKLKDESAHLLALSLELALQGMRADGKQEAPQKTLRYREGGVETIARGQLVAEDCGRIYFKSLRDEMISAPKASSSCAQDK